MEIILFGQRNLKHLSSVNLHPLVNSLHTTWCEANAIIKTWLLENMSSSLSDHFLRIPIVNDIWDKAHHMHTKRNDEWEISCLTTKATNFTQRNKTMMKYVGELETTWMKTDHYTLVTNPDSAEWANILKYHLYRVVSGLNSPFVNLADQLLNRGKKPVGNVEQTSASW